MQLVKSRINQTLVWGEPEDLQMAMKELSMHHHYKPQPHTKYCQFYALTKMDINEAVDSIHEQQLQEGASENVCKIKRKVQVLWNGLIQKSDKIQLLHLHQASTTQQKLMYELLENAKY